MTDRPAGPDRAAADEQEAPAPATGQEPVDAPEGVGGEPDHASELQAARDERDRYLEALQRMKAEFDNFRKRNERERQTIALGATREVVRGLLPVMDNLERAVAALGDQGAEIVAGLEMVRGQLAALLTGHGVEEIPAHGQPFDPTIHEAIASVPSPRHSEGMVVEVVEKGYRQSDHVLRPTRVVIASDTSE